MSSPVSLLSRLKKAWRYHRALRHRARATGTVFIGITGSSGKSTATALAAAILAGKGRCQQTDRYNALADVIRTIRATDADHRYCVIEIAAGGPDTIGKQVDLLRPDIAAITLIGREHHTAFRNLEAVATEKARLVLAPPTAGIAVLNIDDPRVREIGARTSRRVIGFGRDPDATLRLIDARSVWPEPLRLVVAHAGTEFEVKTRLHGRHQAVPVLTALGIALAAEVPLATALAAIERFDAFNGRMQPVTTPDGINWIRDDYKAPAWSLAAPLEFLAEARAGRKVAIFGTISDTTGDSSKNYRNFARRAREAAELVVFIGPLAHRALRASSGDGDSSIQAFSTLEAAAPWLATALRAGDLVLLKGSHKADHLMRLVLDREAPITCWVERCRKPGSCATCPDLRRPGASRDAGSA